jgi:Raf kinase inhibitor-like YbhB/YbcL family protein
MKVLKAVFLLLASAIPAMAQNTPGTAAPPPFTLTSASFQDGGVIPDKYTSLDPSGGISPELEWVNPPTGTVSYTLIMHDPDNAPRKHLTDTLHWMMFNIPGSLAKLPEGIPAQAQLSDGSIQGKTRVTGFMGPGARGIYHHYTIELFALDTKLDLGPDATREQVQDAIDGHILGKAVVEGRFHR